MPSTQKILSVEQIDKPVLNSPIGPSTCLSFLDTILGPAVQSVVSLTSLLRVISLTVLVDSIYNILIFFAEKNVSSCKSYLHFFSKIFQDIRISLDIN